MPSFNFDEITHIAKVGVNRASIFMGFAVNVSRNPHLQEFNVLDRPEISITPPEIPESDHRINQEEFANWAIANGLRDLSEYFEVFLNGVYGCLVYIELWQANYKEEYSTEENIEKLNKFEQNELVKKLKILKTQFSLEIDFSEQLLSLYKARNCLTHRLGIVGVTDILSSDQPFMTIDWRVPVLFGYEKNGSEYIPEQNVFPMVFPEGSSVHMRYQVKQKTVSLGERITFSPAELKEICLTYLLAIDQVKEAFVTFSKQRGVTINYTDSNKTDSDDIYGQPGGGYAQ